MLKRGDVFGRAGLETLSELTGEKVWVQLGGTKYKAQGTVNINYPDWDTFAPFGGYKQSGNGREYADFGIHDFLEIKGVVGWG
jgi:hypothetical protein